MLILTTVEAWRVECYAQWSTSLCSWGSRRWNCFSRIYNWNTRKCPLSKTLQSSGKKSLNTLKKNVTCPECSFVTDSGANVTNRRRHLEQGNGRRSPFKDKCLQCSFKASLGNQREKFEVSRYFSGDRFASASLERLTQWLQTHSTPRYAKILYLVVQNEGFKIGILIILWHFGVRSYFGIKYPTICMLRILNAGPIVEGLLMMLNLEEISRNKDKYYLVGSI